MASGSENSARETTNAQESQVIPHPSHLAVFDVILKALLQIDVFHGESARVYDFPIQDDHDDAITVLNRIFLPETISSSSERMDINGIFNMYTKMMDNLAKCGNDLYTLFEISQSMEMTCYNCKKPAESLTLAFGETMTAGYLKQLKSMFTDLKFETIFKFAKAATKTTCPYIECGIENFIEPQLDTLPSVFALELRWLYNEDETYIGDVLSVLEDIIDLTAIYKYEGDRQFVNYEVVSMVCTQQEHPTQEGEVRYTCLDMEPISAGEDWKAVASALVAEYIRPEILFFEQVKESVPRNASSVVPKPTEASSSSGDLKRKAIEMDN